MEKKTARSQINKLLGIDAVSGFAIAGAAWVALLAARGFSTIEIGLLESIFHITSLAFEIPSGVVADVFGRRKTMVASRVMMVISSILMIFSKDFFTVAVAIAVNALSYNLASGTREALAYDSLKAADIEKEYDSFASNDVVIYQIFGSIGTLLAGLALLLGYRKAYGIDVVVGIATMIIAAMLVEVKTEVHKTATIRERFKRVIGESTSFIRQNRKARIIIIINAIIGAVDVLILFFLQAKLPELGMNKLWLGPALFIMGMGAALGAKMTEIFPEKRYGRIVVYSTIGVLLAFSSVFTGNYYIMVIGGFVGAFADDFIQVRTDILLNSMIPSEQRATLMSVNSFAYSVVMIVLSPVFGFLFS